MIIVTAILMAAVVGLLFYGSLPAVPLAILCVSAAGFLAVIGGHSHEGVLSIDVLALRSRLCCVNAGLKTWGCLFLLGLCVAVNSISVGVALTVIMLLLTVLGGGLPLRDYLSMLSLPAAFMLVSGLALLFSYETAPVGVLNFSFFGGWLSVTRAAQAVTLHVMAKALGAVGCLYLLSLSTPMTEIIGVLRRARVPALVVELMYLIYRYIFILLDMHRTMHDAAESRLGYNGYGRSLKTTGQIYGNLLSRSFQKANMCFDAMESRCYEGEIRFLEQSKPVKLWHAVTGGCVALPVLLLAVWERLG